MTSPREGAGYPKLVTKSDLAGSGVHANSEITSKKNMYKFKKDLVLDLGRRLGTGFIDL